MLEIYAPGELKTVLRTYESDAPFLSIQAGDIINPRTFADERWAGWDETGKLLRVVNLEHFIWDSKDGVRHKIGVITQAVPDTFEGRERWPG